MANLPMLRVVPVVVDTSVSTFVAVAVPVVTGTAKQIKSYKPHTDKIVVGAVLGS